MAMNLNYRNLPPRLLRHHHRQVDEAPAFLNSKTHHHRLPPRLLKLRHQQQTLQSEERQLQTGGAISTGVIPFVAAAAAAVEPAAPATVGAFLVPYNPISSQQQQQHPWPPQLLSPPPQPPFHDQLLLEQHHPSQFLFPSAPVPPPHLYTPLPDDAGHCLGFFDGFFYTDSHIAAAAAVPVPGYLYQPQDFDESCIDVFVQAVVPPTAHNNKPGVDQVVCESYVGDEQQQYDHDGKSQHKQQQQYDHDGKKIIGEGLAILNIVHGAAYDELHVGSGSSGGGIRVPGPFKVGEEEVVLPASLDELDTSFVVIVPKH